MQSTQAYIARIIVAGIIWVGVMVLGIFTVIAMSSGGDSSIVAVAIAAFITAAVSTGFLLNNEDNAKAIQASQDSSKRKNENAGFDAMSLLTPQDLADLREDIKDRLRERILSGEDGELSSLDSLLADQRKRK